MKVTRATRLEAAAAYATSHAAAMTALQEK